MQLKLWYAQKNATRGFDLTEASALVFIFGVSNNVCWVIPQAEYDQYIW